MLVVHPRVEGLPRSTKERPTVAAAMWAVRFHSEEASFCLVRCPVELLVELHVLQQRQHLLCLGRWLATLGRRLAFDQDILHCFQLEMPLLLIVLESQLQTLLREAPLLELLLLTLNNILWVNGQEPADIERIRRQESIGLCSPCLGLATARLED